MGEAEDMAMALLRRKLGLTVYGGFPLSCLGKCFPLKIKEHSFRFVSTMGRMYLS